MKRVLLFGGTFDPPHVGHLTMAQLALEQTDAQEVWLLPAPLPPHKMGEAHLPYARRVKMTETLIEGFPNLYVSTLESSLTGPSYTVDTVAAFSVRYPQFHFRFLIGSDSLAELPTWHRAGELVQRIGFVVAVRSSHLLEQVLRETLQALPGLQVQVMEMPMLDISSTWLRNRLDLGQSVCELVPNRVLRIWQQGTEREP